MLYSEMKDRAERIAQDITDRARAACAEAGLDPGLLGIHPHNAMVSFDSGHPWRGVDYSKVRLCQRLIKQSWEPHRIVDRWYARQPHWRQPEIFGWDWRFEVRRLNEAARWEREGEPRPLGDLAREHGVGDALWRLSVGESIEVGGGFFPCYKFTRI